MSIFSIFTLLGGLAFFIYGMNQMSHSLEIIAGEKMEAIINRLTSNRCGFDVWHDADEQFGGASC